MAVHLRLLQPHSDATDIQGQPNASRGLPNGRYELSGRPPGSKTMRRNQYWPLSEFEIKCQKTSDYRYNPSYPPSDARRYGGHPPALWRRIVRWLTDLGR
jgi:hypothetical protein